MVLIICNAIILSMMILQLFIKSEDKKEDEER